MMFVIHHDKTRPEERGRYTVSIHNFANDSVFVFHCDREYLETMADEMTRWLEVPEEQALGPAPVERALATIRTVVADTGYMTEPGWR